MLQTSSWQMQRGQRVHTRPDPASKPHLQRLPAAEQKVGAVIITALDEVAWLLNLRGGDVEYNPVFISYVIVTPDAATLYVDSAKVGLCSCRNSQHSLHILTLARLGDCRPLPAVGPYLYVLPVPLITCEHESLCNIKPS